jgi:hypothetical protein
MEERKPVFVAVSPEGYDVLVGGASREVYDPREFQVVLECVRSCGIEFFGCPVIVVKTLIDEGIAHYHAVLASDVGGVTVDLDVTVRLGDGDPTLIITASTPIGEFDRTVVVGRFDGAE